VPDTIRRKSWIAHVRRVGSRPGGRGGLLRDLQQEPILAVLRFDGSSMLLDQVVDTLLDVVRAPGRVCRPRPQAVHRLDPGLQTEVPDDRDSRCRAAASATGQRLDKRLRRPFNLPTSEAGSLGVHHARDPKCLDHEPTPATITSSRVTNRAEIHPPLTSPRPKPVVIRHEKPMDAVHCLRRRCAHS